MMKKLENLDRIEEVKSMIRDRVASFASQLSGYQVFLFGSRATVGARPRSDFDVGVCGPRPLPPQVYWAIEEALEELPTLYQIEWVDLANTTPFFLQEAMKHKEILYDGIRKRLAG